MKNDRLWLLSDNLTSILMRLMTTDDESRVAI